MSFDPTKPVQTRNGRAARIISTDRKMGNGNVPIVALVADNSGGEAIASFYADGTHWANGDQQNDLINVDEFAKPGRYIVKNRDGQRAWVLTLDTPWKSTTPIVAIVEGHQRVTYYRKDGTWASSDKDECPYDLIF